MYNNKEDKICKTCKGEGCVSCMGSEEGVEIINKLRMLRQDRSPYEPTWDAITELVVPSRGTFVNQDMTQSTRDPERKNRRRLDSTATLAHRALTARIIAEETNAGSRWFDWRMEDQTLDRTTEVRRFLYDLSDRTFSFMNSGSFRMAHVEFTADWCSYGTACLSIEETDTDLVWKSVPHTEIFFTENKDGEVDIIYREFMLTYRQAKEFFGDEKLPESTREAGHKNPSLKFKFVHCVEPNPDYNPRKKHKDFLQFMGTYVDDKTKAVLRRDHYTYKPYIVGRFWKRSGEVWGGSPAMDALPDIRMLNKAIDDLSSAVQLAIRPPLAVAHDAVLTQLNMRPFGQNFGAIDSQGNMLVKGLLNTNPDFRSMLQFVESLKMTINAAFFVDPLSNRQGSIRTAAEVGKRSNEELTGTAPFLARYEVEYLIPVLDIVKNFIINKLKALPVPEVLVGKAQKIEFTSPLAKTQRGQELQNKMQFMQVVQQLATVFPEVLQHLNVSNMLNGFADLFGVPQTDLKSEQEVLAGQQQQQQAMQMEQLQASITQAAGTMSDLSKSGLIGRQDLGLPALPVGAQGVQ